MSGNKLWHLAEHADWFEWWPRWFWRWALRTLDRRAGFKHFDYED